MTVSTPHQRDARVLYCTLMGEIKLRVDVVTKLLNQTYLLPERPAFELCCLELRMICELIALACAAVHGDTPGSRSAKLRSAHEADYILKTMSKLHADFYPAPGIILDQSDGGKVFLHTRDGYMTKLQLQELYNGCGDILHRGDLIKARELPAIDFKDIQIAMSKIIELLRVHQIAFFNSQDRLWVIMGDKPTDPVKATLQRPVNH